MLSKNTIKTIRNLHRKKFRLETGMFIVEGEKMVKELISSKIEVESVYSIDPFPEYQVEIISPKELERISAFKTPNRMLAVAKMPTYELDITLSAIVLDGVNDPGNLGTIIRTADWFGISQIICSVDTVDCFNPKTVQSSMGSSFRMKVVYTDIAKYLEESSLPSYAAVMNGDRLNAVPSAFNLVMGSESHGVRNGIDKISEYRITIPRIGEAESLNVGVAAGILMSKLCQK